MFTGIIDHCGTIRDVQTIADGARITIETLFSDFDLGESIALDGVCLTLVESNENDPLTQNAVIANEAKQSTPELHESSRSVHSLAMTAVSSHFFTVELSPETLQKTTSKNWKEGSVVNLERALRVGDRLGGHWVTGHVDTTLTIKAVNRLHDYREVIFSIDNPEYMHYLVQKGSVAINGVSLTINEVFEDGFSVMLIPHTQERTNLSKINEGDTLNVEFDYLIKGVRRLLSLQAQ